MDFIRGHPDVLNIIMFAQRFKDGSGDHSDSTCPVTSEGPAGLGRPPEAFMSASLFAGIWILSLAFHCHARALGHRVGSVPPLNGSAAHMEKL